MAKLEVIGRTKLSHGRVSAGIVSVGDVVYVVGGFDDAQGYEDEIAAFRPGDAKARVVGRLLRARENCTAIAADGVIYVVGGSTRRGEVVFEVERFDPATGKTLVIGETKAPRHRPTVLSVAPHRLLVIAGDPRDGAMATAEAIDTTTGVSALAMKFGWFPGARAAYVLSGRRIVVVGQQGIADQARGAGFLIDPARGAVALEPRDAIIGRTVQLDERTILGSGLGGTARWNDDAGRFEAIDAFAFPAISSMFAVGGRAVVIAEEKDGTVSAFLRGETWEPLDVPADLRLARHDPMTTVAGDAIVWCGGRLDRVPQAECVALRVR